MLTKSAHVWHHHGLRRLIAVVTKPLPHRHESPLAVARRLAWCLAWGPGDTCESVLLRHPELAPSAKVLAGRVRGLRRFLGLGKGAHIRHWRVVQDYLELHHPGFSAVDP